MTTTFTTVFAKGPTGGKAGRAEAEARPRFAWSQGVPAGTRIGWPSTLAQSVAGSSGLVITLRLLGKEHTVVCVKEVVRTWWNVAGGFAPPFVAAGARVAPAREPKLRRLAPEGRLSASSRMSDGGRVTPISQWGEIHSEGSIGTPIEDGTTSAAGASVTVSGHTAFPFYDRRRWYDEVCGVI